MRALVFAGFMIFLLPCILIHPYVGVLLYSWISFMSPHRMLYSFPTSIPLALIAALLTILSWVASKEPKKLHFDATVWLILAFMAWISLTTIAALNPAIAIEQWSRVSKV